MDNAFVALRKVPGFERAETPQVDPFSAAELCERERSFGYRAACLEIAKRLTAPVDRALQDELLEITDAIARRNLRETYGLERIREAVEA